MPINSLDGLMNRTTNGLIYSTDWQFTSNVAAAAGRWADIPRLTNNFLYANTNGDLAWVSCNSATTIAMPTGPDVTASSGETKHVFFASAMCAQATGIPGYLLLVDLQGYWANINGTIATTQNLTGTPAPRYANGEGCMLYTVTTVATGTGTPTYAISYTNSAGTTGRALPLTVTAAASTPLGYIHHATGAASGSGPFLPLAGGDTGVANVASVTFTSPHATSARFALCLARPLLSVPLAVVNNITERDFVTQLTSLPEVKNDACLVWLYFPGAATAANTNFYGSMEFVWG